MKLADLLGVVGDSPLTQFPWHTSLLAALNTGVGEHVKVDDTLTGKELVAELMLRGSDHFLDLMQSTFDPSTGLLTPAEEVPTPAPTPAPAEMVTVTAPAPVTVHSGQSEKFTFRQIMALFAGALILIISIMLAITVSITSVKNNGEITPGQERLMGKIVDVAGQLAKTNQEEEQKITTPAPTADPVFGGSMPLDPNHPFYPDTTPQAQPVNPDDQRPNLMQQ
jgi:hypothetical protein